MACCPDAVIVAADVIAVGVLQAFNAVGVLVPRDISVISINNQTISQLTSPPLSTFSIDQNELARVATLMLGDAISANARFVSMRTCRRRWWCAIVLCRQNSGYFLLLYSNRAISRLAWFRFDVEAFAYRKYRFW